MLMAVIDTKEEQDIVCAILPNAFVQAEMPKSQDSKGQVIMKIAGVLVDMLVQLNPELHGPHVVHENNWKVLHV